jgi:hypothetical protein
MKFNKIEWQRKYRLKPERRKKDRLTSRKSARRNAKLIDDLKINGCAICGYDGCNRSLHFHHTNYKMKCFNVDSNAMNRMDKKIVIELNKCILLCANCHMCLGE